VLGLTPWAIRNLRFDESLGQAIHGYDFDLCLQARTKGKKVVTADLKVVHHHDLKLIRDVGNWIEAHIKIAEKWDGKVPLVGEEGGGNDWKARARRAEAQASAERMISLSSRLYRDARIEKLQRGIDHERAQLAAERRAREAAQRQLARCTSSASWRLTAPARALARRFRRLRPGAGAQGSR
jgi:hypothetical protein